ncbi:protein translocase subunit SecD [Telmatospirillum sp.]|uniref:protein translocase subunit SecD n=1 Tax=Telmatospirillum sp. TaxID=2079197 RepID=UPI00284BFCB0|nr:protein translocase subunit SecD [Telmatospirillum sp.]MDR3435693.1 protein translocase subunit SecD [Telmatospirillum sp.]
MNRYPRWKYVIILVALVLGLTYSLPNIFGEVPAVQISPANSVVQIDQALLGRVEQELKTQQIQSVGIISDASGIKVKLGDTDTQLKVKDILQKSLGENYTVALNLLSASPDWLASIGAMPMYLGLDLRGGVHFLMQVDMKAALNKQLDRQTNDVRNTLRDAKVPLGGVSREGQTLVVKFKDADTRAQGGEELRKNLHDMTTAQLDDTRIVLTLTPEALKKFQDAALQQNVLTLRNRVNELGVAEPIIQQQGTDRVVVQLPGVQDTAKAKDILGRTASLEVRMVDEEHADVQSLQNAARGLVPPGDEFFSGGRDGQPLLIKKVIVLTGENISNASGGFDNRTNEPAVHINLDTRGSRIFAQVTRDNVGKRMAILLIEKNKGEVVTAPVIRQQIDGGQVQITGRMSVKDANDVALLLRAGALAAPMEIIEERTIGPSLGAENINKGVHSVLWGFVAIAVFMSIYYRVVGLFSTLALACNVLLLVALLSLMQATLTLPGIAAIALTVGMAIDANVLINERIREELRAGHTVHAAIHAGYEHAFGTILDTNVTNFIAGVALFAYGTGPVRGFAVVLCLGILTSMFSAILVSRALVNLTYGRKRKIDHLSI